jgi:hypothetical protein
MGKRVANVLPMLAASAVLAPLLVGSALGDHVHIEQPPRTNGPAIGPRLQCPEVSTAQQLTEALASAEKCIYVADYAGIDLSQVAESRGASPEHVLYIPEGVTLESGRSPTDLGGLLYLSHQPSQKTMLDLGQGARVTGLRLRGAYLDETVDHKYGTDGIEIEKVDDVVVDNNEIYDWPNAGVEVSHAPNSVGQAGRIHITENFIHDNVQCGAGYGVAVGGSGFGLIDRNVFNDNRHDVSDDGLPGTGYVARSNFVLSDGQTCGGHYEQHFDMHGTGGGSAHDGGTAGEYVEIRNNTIRGDQSYGFFGHLNRPAFALRGRPVEEARFIDNAVAHKDEDAAVRVEGADRDELESQRKLVVSGNMYNVNTSKELGVGDFNGDGQADVFQATGAVWVYSPSGSREWRFLNNSTLRLGRLAFGDFNGDGKTDVFTQSGARWLVSYSGTGPWQALPAGSNIDMKYYRFGDFDGDGKTDIFRANGSHFYISSAGASGWEQLAQSKLTIDQLRFGDFNGDGKMDVFSLANGQWSVSYGATSHWQRLNVELTSDLGKLVFADFNGDGRTDIAREHNGEWEVSYGGVTPWQVLSRSRPRFFAMLFADFNGDKRADVLQYGALGSPPTSFNSFPRFKLSSGGVGSLTGWSLQDML